MSHVENVRVVFQTGLGPTEVRLARPLFPVLALTPGQTVTLQVGRAALPAKLSVAANGDQPPNTCSMSRSLGERLRLHNGERLHARHDPEQDLLHLGPFVGILTIRRMAGAHPLHLFGQYTPYLLQLTRNGQRLAIPTYVFSPRDIDWQSGSVSGFVFRGPMPGGRWHRSRRPLPDVVYDRIPSRKVDLRESVRTAKTRLKELAGPAYFNPGYFEKWQSHNLLVQSPEVQRFLPETARFTGAADLAAFLRRFGTVYLKPVTGSLGLGIIVVHRLRGGGYVYRYRTRATGPRIARTGSIRSLVRALRPLMGNRTYIMQRGLRLARYRGSHFDVRLVMQKDAGGAWQLTKVYCRIATPGAITSNLTRGGEGRNLPAVLRGTFGRRARIVMHRIKLAADTLPAAIEAQVEGTLGELGIDLGIDRSGRLWIIEINSKPFLQMTRGSGPRSAIRQSALRPLRWARYLAGFEPATRHTARSVS